MNASRLERHGPLIWVCVDRGVDEGSTLRCGGLPCRKALDDVGRAQAADDLHRPEHPECVSDSSAHGARSLGERDRHVDVLRGRGSESAAAKWQSVGPRPVLFAAPHVIGPHSSGEVIDRHGPRWGLR